MADRSLIIPEEIDDEEFNEVEISASEDEDDNKQNHSKLLGAIRALNKNKKTQRTEPSLKVSEFAVSDPNSDTIKLHELTVSLGQTPSLAALKKQLRRIQRKKDVLPAPLPKPATERIKRTVAYEKVCEELKKWDSVVQHNRLAEQIEYPVNQTPIQLETAKEATKRFKPMTPLELEVAALLQGSKHFLQDDKMLTEAEEKSLTMMSEEEAKEKRKELQKMRALQSYMASKARWQNKIKSKRYHRLLKRDKIKKQQKEFEELQRTNPDAAIQKLEEIEQNRIVERMTLKHRNTGKWAKHLAIKSKYDKQARQELHEQLQLSRQLTQKKASLDSAEKEEEENDNDPALSIQALPGDANNPWIQGNSEKDAVDETVLESYQKVWEATRNEMEKQKEKTKDRTRVLKVDKVQTLEQEAQKKLEEHVRSEMKQLKKKAKRRKSKAVEKVDKNIDKHPESVNDDIETYYPLLDEVHGMESVSTSLSSKLHPDLDLNTEEEDCRVNSEDKNMKNGKNAMKETKDVKIDPLNFMKINETKVKSFAPALIDNGDEALDEDSEEDSMKMTIAEAFADDDVVLEFKEEKNASINKDKPADIDLFLPGWGSWAGAGLKINERKKKRFLIKAPPLPKRRDDNKGNLIINEEKDKKFTSHQVSEVPFPFRSVREFERSIRTPIGKNWQPETAFRKMIVPRVTTKIGSIIEPIDAETLVKKNKDVYSEVKKKLQESENVQKNPDRRKNARKMKRKKK